MLMVRHLWIIVLATIVGGVLTFGCSKMILPLEYSSHITMYVQSYTGIAENINNNENNISNSKQLVNTYMEVLKDDAVMNAVGELLMKNHDKGLLANNFEFENGEILPESIRKCLSISSVLDTSAVKVTATTKSPEIAADLCNTLTKVAPEYVEKAVGVGSINTIDVAKVYNTPVAPNSTKNGLTGAAIAFMLSMLIIFVIDFFDNTVKDSTLLGDRYKKAIIGEIQQYGTDKKNKTSMRTAYFKLTDRKVPFYIVESYKSIRTNMNFSLSTMDKKIFAVSSCNPGEGKSVTSSNIAIAFAQGGQRVLLIDADMRKSMQHKIFKLNNKTGLSSAISKMNTLEECIQTEVMENLDIMTAGPIPPNPSELLASSNMSEILQTLSKQYSVIIMDTPPINVVTDAVAMAKDVSGIVMVVRFGSTTDEDLDEAIGKIDFAQMNMFGFILNDIQYKHSSAYYAKKNGKYYKKGYGYGSGYGYYVSKPTEPELQKEKDSALDF